MFHLDWAAKTYRQLLLPDAPKDHQRAFRPRPKPASGAKVDVTIVADGERRAIAPYQAVRIRIRIKVEPGKGARTLPGETQIDGWYLDLPGLFCRQELAQEAWFRNLSLPGSEDRVVLHQAGSRKHGLVVEESSISKQGGNILVSRTELLEVSQKALADAVFEVPPDYSPATPGQRSGTRMLLRGAR